MLDTLKAKNIMLEIIKEIKDVAAIYKAGENKKAELQVNASRYSQEFMTEQLRIETAKIYSSATPHFDKMESLTDDLHVELQKNDQTIETDNVDFMNCLQIIASVKGKPDSELLSNIADKYAGHRMALITFLNSVQEEQQFYFRDKIINSSVAVDKLKDAIVSASLDFPSNVMFLVSLRDEIVKLSSAIGEEMTAEETNMGTDYNELVNLQMRAAMGLQN